VAFAWPLLKRSFGYLILRPVLLSLPVKPYILKFLTRHLGRDYQLSNCDLYGIHLFNLLRQERDHRQYDNFLARYTAQFPVNIVPYMITDRGCKNFTALTIVKFNVFAEEIFYKEFHDFVQFRVEETGMPAKAAIERFSIKFGLVEDDVAFETLKRNWNRYWQKEKKRQKAEETPTSLSLAFPLAA
jgi:hypothetical protein